MKATMKKVLSMLLVITLTAGIAVGGTMAYLTKDAGDETNVFTIGEINVSLDEDVEIIGEGGEVKKTEAGADYTEIMPGDYLKKEVTVTNNGKTDAYVAVTVDVNNFKEIQRVIEAYGDDNTEAETMLDNVFHGWGMTVRDRYVDGKKDMSYKVNELVDSHILHVDSAKRIFASDVAHFSILNWFKSEAEKAAGSYTVAGVGNSYYAGDMEDYSLRFTYYIYLPAGESATLFNGLNVPAEFTADQMKMFDGLQIDVVAKAIQADNMAVADVYKDDENGKAKTAFAILAGKIAVPEFTNAPSPVDKWDGTADTSWYDPANPLIEYSINTAEQLAGLAELVSGDTTFKGVTFTLESNLDLYCEDTTAAADGDPLSFRPIGDKSKNGTFEGKFDGNGKTISNLYQNGWDLGYSWDVYGSYGLFGNLNDATVKDLTITGAESYIEGGDVGGITGSATGTCVFENITITDSDFATYNNGNGGIIGWSGAGNYTFKNITIAEDVTLAGLWGSFDSSIGGIVGQAEPGATYNFENVDIACRLDVYNDVTASYDYYNYRMCGMIIGRLEETTTIDGVNYPDTSKYNITCEDVSVTYGEWADYHYCRAAGARGVRAEAGYSYNGIAADYDHSVCTVHHLECIVFDQIFGGAQYGVKGLAAYDGVTVTYNNDKE